VISVKTATATFGNFSTEISLTRIKNGERSLCFRES
jgi:hypothetical protein